MDILLICLLILGQYYDFPMVQIGRFDFAMSLRIFLLYGSIFMARAISFKNIRSNNKWSVFLIWLFMQYCILDWIYIYLFRIEKNDLNGHLRESMEYSSSIYQLRQLLLYSYCNKLLFIFSQQCYYFYRSCHHHVKLYH